MKKLTSKPILKRASGILNQAYATPKDIAWAWVTLLLSQEETKRGGVENHFSRVTEFEQWILALKLILETILIIAIITYYKKQTNTNWFFILPFLFLFVEPQYLKYSFTFLSESFNSILIFFLTVLFLTLKNSRKFNIVIPIISATIIICHPVSSFSISIFMGFYCLINLKSHFKISLLHGVIFVIFLAIWPLRNSLTFNKGIYLTASQGATFSKGWNETVAADFTNVEGDLTDEGLNLKYITNRKIKQPIESVLMLSKIYQEATINYINTLSFNQKATIIYKKIKSNFNPFPEKSKPGFLEDLSILFRILSLILFMQLFRRLLQYKKFNFESQVDKAFVIVLSIFIGQLLMSAYIYTGLRFNAIYSLSLLFCFMIVNKSIINVAMNKIV